MGGASHRVRRVVRCGLWIGGVVDELGEAAGVRAVCGVPHGRGNGGCVLGVEDGGLSNQDSGASLFALIPNTHLEIICDRGTSVCYHRFRSGVPPSGIATAPAPAATLSLPQKLRRDSCAY